MDIASVLLIIIGIGTGIVIGIFYAKSQAAKHFQEKENELRNGLVSRSDLNQLQLRYKELDERSVDIKLYQNLESKLDELNQGLIEKEGQLRSSISIRENLEEKLKNQKEELESLQQRFQKEFENLSNRILEEKSEKFIKMNEEKVTQLLNPLKDRIKSFEEKVDQNNKETIAYGAALKEQLKHIAETSKQMSADTLRLTKALKGDKKLQGDWGEMQLEAILNAAGLQENVHYEAQKSFDSEEGNKQRLDYLIRLPDDKHLILDAKVSLVDYDTVLNEDLEESERQIALRKHLKAIEKHIDELGGRNYQKLEGIQTPDYVLMFFPIEPALYLALREEPRLFEKALDKNVVLVSTSTLLATLRTVSYIWKQENQNRNVREIARESGALYDKFVGFMEDLVAVGKKMDEAKKSYGLAMNKLVESSKRGGTVIGRIERLKELGAETSKKLPQSIIDRVDD
jgi:DNA recombination protein RmuC